MGQALIDIESHMAADRFIECGHVRLRVRAEGTGPTVMFVHGWALDLDMWQPQFAALAGDYGVIAFDRRGFGLSQGEPDVDQDVEDALVIARSFGNSRIILVGMSQGARVAFRFAHRFADRLAGLILDGPPHLVVPSADELPMGYYRELVATRGLDAFREQWIEHPLMQVGNVTSKKLLRRIVDRYPGRDLLRAAAHLPGEEPDPTRVRVPTLLINGDRDSAARLSAGEQLASYMPNSHRIILSGAGHLPNLDNPVAYNACVRAFVREHL